MPSFFVVLSSVLDHSEVSPWEFPGGGAARASLYVLRTRVPRGNLISCGLRQKHPKMAAKLLCIGRIGICGSF